ncbi:type I restriction enzyme HsdR N-terminal domain-containing protein [Pelosinus sp. sgz500959]|uniref:type I restriction enzyme HsdR N-terminal domain-containing protein n=1 Tax=Pelosinus sp. sgz500959 TaxID=3242472 RepID=UPI003670A35C
MLKKYYRLGKQALFDQSRKIFVLDGPEERVRQEFVQNLVEKYDYPIQVISTEYPLYHIDPRSRRRADIVVWGYDAEEEQGRPVFVIEIKAPDVPLTDEVKEQVLDYQKILSCKFVAICNSCDLFNAKVYHMSNDGNWMLLEEFPTYEQILNETELEFLDDSVWAERMSYMEVTNPQYLESLIFEECILGLETPKVMQGLIAEFNNFLLSEPIAPYLPISYGGLTIKEDIGISHRNYGNAAGSSVRAFFRSFVIQDIDGNDQIYRLAIKAEQKTQNHPKWGNRKATTTLFLAIDDFDLAPHTTLGLCFDTSAKINDDVFVITHSGRMAAGKGGSVKNQVVIDNVKKYAPFLICDKLVHLGMLPVGRTISWNDAKDFLLKLFVYGNVRDKVRMMHKEEVFIIDKDLLKKEKMKKVVPTEFSKTYMDRENRIFIKQEGITFEELKNMVAMGQRYPVRILLKENRDEGLLTECAVVWVSNRIIMVVLNDPDNIEELIGCSQEEFKKSALVSDAGGNIEFAVYLEITKNEY